MNTNAAHDIETKISNLYATECWLMKLKKTLDATPRSDPHYLAWEHFIEASESRREMLRYMAKLEGCRISFDLIRPRGVFSYDYAGLAEEVSGANAEQNAETLNGLSRHMILEYLHLLRLAEQQEAFSLIMSTQCILETMPRDYENFLRRHYRQIA